MNVLWVDAITLCDEPGVAEVCQWADDCGQRSLVRIDFTSGEIAVAGPEFDDDGSVDGYTYALYGSEEDLARRESWTQDGGTDVRSFLPTFRDLARAAAREDA